MAVTETKEIGAPGLPWQRCTLGDFHPFVTSGSRGWARFYSERGSLFVRITNLSRESIYLDLSDQRFVALPATEREGTRTEVTPGDVLVSITADIGIIGFADEHLPRPAYINQHIAIVRLPPDRIDSKFVSYYLSAEASQRRFREGTDTGAKAGMSLGGIREIQVEFPCLPEQQQISAALSDVDDLLSALDRLIIKQRAIKTGAMQELLSGRTRLPGFSGEWEEKKIGQFTDCTAGGTPSTQIRRYWGGDIRWMASGELHLKTVQDVEGRITEDGLRHSSAKLIPAGCVLIGLAGQGKTRGTVAINRVPLSTNQSIAAIFPATAFDSKYLYFNLDARYDELRDLSTGDGGRGGLNLTIIRNITVPFPSLQEQEAIATVLSDMDGEIAALEARRAKTAALKRGTMQALLTGRVRLPVEEEVAA